jgi:type II secretory pathway predicted ATPase ExeA
MRGAVGIGKSFALDRIARELEEQGVLVVMITATEAISGNINAFLKAVLGHYHTETGSSADAEEAAWGILAGRPFMASGRRTILIVDEGQKLAGRVLETIRGFGTGATMRGSAMRTGAHSAASWSAIRLS